MRGCKRESAAGVAAAQRRQSAADKTRAPRQRHTVPPCAARQRGGEEGGRTTSRAERSARRRARARARPLSKSSAVHACPECTAVRAILIFPSIPRSIRPPRPPPAAGGGPRGGRAPARPRRSIRAHGRDTGGGFQCSRFARTGAFLNIRTHRRALLADRMPSSPVEIIGALPVPRWIVAQEEDTAKDEDTKPAAGGKGGRKRKDAEPEQETEAGAVAVRPVVCSSLILPCF